MRSIRERFTYLARRRSFKIIFVILPFIIAILPLTALHAEDKPETVIGAVEEVVLSPWGVKFPARIDTGSELTSLDVRDLTIKNKVSQFRLPEKYGNILLSLPVIRYIKVRSADSRGRRPVVEMEFCVGSRRIRTQANLYNRSQVEYPLILGRNVLNQGFIVDCAEERMLALKCLEGASQ